MAHESVESADAGQELEDSFAAKFGQVSIEEHCIADDSEWSEWSEAQWDETKQQWYSSRTNNTSKDNYYYWHPNETLAEVEAASEDESRSTNLEEKTRWALDKFQPRKLCKQYSRDSLDPSYRFEMNAPEGYFGYYKRVPAADLSATVLWHHLNYAAFSSKTARKESCRRVCCDKRTSHFPFDDTALVLYTRGKEKGFLIKASKELSDTHISALETQSQRFASAHGLELQNLAFAEFDTAQWIQQENSNSHIRNGGDETPSYFGATVCSRCRKWNPYSMKCLHKRCGKRLPSLDETYSTNGSVGRRAIEAQRERVEAEELHPGEDAGFALGGMAMMAIVSLSLIGGTLGGA